MLGELRNVDPATVRDRHAGARHVHRLPGNDVGPAWTELRMGACRVSAPILDVGSQAAGAAARGDADVRRLAPRSPPATSRTCTTTGTRRRRGGRRTSSSTSSPTPGWCSASSPTGPGRTPSSSRIGIRLGVPGTPYDTLMFSGEVTASTDGVVTLKIAGTRQPWATTSSPTRRLTVRCLMPAVSCPARPPSPASAPPSSPRTPGAASCGWPPRRCSTRSTTPGLTPADVDGLVTFTMDTNTEVAVARALGHRGAQVLLPRSTTAAARRAPPCSRRRWPSPPGDRGLRGLLPRVQRALGHAVRPGADAAGGERRLDRRRQLVLAYPMGCPRRQRRSR